MKVFGLIVATGTAIVLTGSAILMRNDYYAVRVDRELLQKIDQLCTQGGGEFRDEFVSDEVIDEVRCQFGHGTTYSSTIKQYDATIAVAAQNHPDYYIGYATQCKIISLLDDENGNNVTEQWSATNTNKFEGRAWCGPFEDLECKTTFTVKSRV